MKHKQEAQEPNIVKVAKAIGKAAGKIAVLAGVERGETEQKPPARAGKLPKKNKHRLPRRLKKAHSRRAARQSPGR